LLRCKHASRVLDERMEIGMQMIYGMKCRDIWGLCVANQQRRMVVVKVGDVMVKQFRFHVQRLRRLLRPEQRRRSIVYR
jgi:hypothetical protein